MRKWVLLGVALGAIAGAGVLVLPLFLNNASNCGNSASSDAQQIIGSMNRAQQAYALEKNRFSSTVEPLGLGLNNIQKIQQDPNYTYSIRATPKAVFNAAIARRTLGIRFESFGPFTWEASYGLVRTYIGAVFLVPVTAIDPKDQSGETTTISILCEATNFGVMHFAEPTYKNGVTTCGVGTEKIY